MTPRSGTEFPAGQDVCREARLRCATACREYNFHADIATAEERSALYNAIINSSTFDNDHNLHSFDEESSNHEVAAHDGGTAAIQAISNLVPPSVAASSSSTTRGTIGPCRGSRPDAAPAACASQPNNSSSPTKNKDNISTKPDAAISTTSPKLAQQSSSPGQRFPGQKLAPYVKPPLYMDYGVNVRIGKTTFINRNCKILDTPVRYVRIGEQCLIGPDFSIYAVAHPVEFDLRCSPAGVPSYGLDVTIGDNVWIGGHVTILGGVRIGDGCVIGANSLVTKDIPAYHLAYGSPARVIRRIEKSTPPSLMSACILPKSLRTRLSSISQSNTLIRRVKIGITSLTLGASICTAVAAFFWLQSLAAS